MKCIAQFRVDTTAKLRSSIGIAKYNEYVKDLESKHGKEKAEAIIAEPTDQLEAVKSAQILYRLANNTHPRGVPKTKTELEKWTQCDQVRLEMGEHDYWDSVRVVGQEFGGDAVERLFAVNKEFQDVATAYERMTGSSIKTEMSQLMGKLETAMDPVRKNATSNSVEDLAASFKNVYPTEDDWKASL